MIGISEKYLDRHGGRHIEYIYDTYVINYKGYSNISSNILGFLDNNFQLSFLGLFFYNSIAAGFVLFDNKSQSILY
jgi:hypothetical protein